MTVEEIQVTLQDAGLMYRSCTSRFNVLIHYEDFLFELHPSDTKNLTKEQVVAKVKAIIIHRLKDRINDLEE